MSIFVLSMRSVVSTVSADELFELENVVSRTCDAPILAPKYHPLYRQATQLTPLKLQRVAQRLAESTFGRYYRFTDFLVPARSVSTTDEPNVLLLGALCGDDLSLLESIPKWRQRFDRVAAYVCDSWFPYLYPEFTRQLDHLFVPMPEMVQELTEQFQIPVTCVPFGANPYEYGQSGGERPIDLISFGRMPDHHHQAFLKAFSQPGCNYQYLRTAPRPVVYNPALPYADRSDLADLQELYQTLTRSKLALCYESVFPDMRKFPHSFVTMRWFEAGATGCVIVGKRPTTPLAAKLLDWPDATIELPDDGEEAAEMVMGLLQEPSRLEAISRQNYLQNLARHDWRWRVKQMLDLLGVPLPVTLKRQLAEIQTQTAELAQVTANA